MGAWGTGHFENDEALDFIASLVKSDDVAKKANEVLTGILDSDFIDSDEGSEYLALVDLLVNDDSDFIDLNDEESIASVIEIYGDSSVDNIKKLKAEVIINPNDIKKSLEKILDEDMSELAELWAEAEDEEWFDLVKSLIDSL